MSDALAPFLEATVRTATPLAFAALGELVAERAGVINIGLEGTIIAGAFGGLVTAGAAGVGAGFVGAICAGMIVAAIFAFFVVTLKSDHIITGTAISMLGVGATGTLYRILYGTTGAALETPTLAPFAIPMLHDIPIVGAAFFAQPAVTYLLYGLVPLLAWWLSRTGTGLALRAVGERPEAAVAAGISPARVRWAALLFCGAMGGLSGGTLVLAQVGTFNEGISAGRGFIAIAIVVLGRWSALGVGGAALLFGAASALQYLAQAMGWGLPYQFSLALPYVLTLIALAGARGRSAAPAALGARG
jgi:ABC-type uncharacterized transport system permease subunit